MSNANTPTLEKDIEDEEMDEEFNDGSIEQSRETASPADKKTAGSYSSASNTKKKTNVSTTSSGVTAAMLIPDLPELTRKDISLKKVLSLMDGDFAPIIPDAVTDYYLAKNGFETTDIKIKRLLALATQKFVSDIAQDAFEYSRIRNSSAVYNSANPQVRAKQLLQGQQFANQQSLTGASGNNAGVEGAGDQQQPSHSSSSNAGNQQGKIVLTMEDLSSALSEYGMNASRPDFYR